MTARLAIIVTLLLGLNLYVGMLRSRPVQPSQTAAVEDIPREVAGYTARDRGVNPQVMAVLGADQTLHRTYRAGRRARPVKIFLGYFETPRENSQIHSPKHCYPGTGWTIAHESTMPVVFGGESLDARSLKITDGDDERLVVYWFHTDSGVITNEFALKWHQMRSALLRRSQRATFVRFSAPVRDDDDWERAEHDVRRFIEILGPHVIDALNREKTS